MADDIDYSLWPTSEEVQRKCRNKSGGPTVAETAEAQVRSAATDLGKAIGWMAQCSPAELTGLRESADLCTRALENAIAFCEGRKTAAAMKAESEAILEAVLIQKRAARPASPYNYERTATYSPVVSTTSAPLHSDNVTQFRSGASYAGGRDQIVSNARDEIEVAAQAIAANAKAIANNPNDWASSLSQRASLIRADLDRLERAIDKCRAGDR